MTNEADRLGPTWSRRRFLGLGAAVAGSAAVLSACGGGEAGAPAPPGSSPTAPAGSFPVTITDKFGPVTIKQPPVRVASVGRTDHDVLLALGIVPACVYRFVPAMTRGVGVWAEPKLGAANPEIITNPISFEKVAALRPDLILDVQATGDEAEYRTLSNLAPTIGLPPNTSPNSVAWQDSTRIISTAVGRKADGEKLVSDTEAVLAKIKADNPSFHGKTVSVLIGSGRQLGVYTTADTRTKLLTSLGLVPSPYVAGLGESKFFVELSPELINDVDADIVLVLTREGLSKADTFAQYPALAASRAAQQNRVTVVEDFNVSLALAAGSVLSIPYAVNGLVPMLKSKFG
ncbi:iron complex transport system substrate-binding protein [Saccharopolyspora erythraea NRRL 2338]|uniref:Iron-siderophore ABC transporter substrate-binding protein n=1 Tax=Saccharopolyspora erythraea TaxID=1836 RepID=A0ABP3NGG3_SACER|nr:ABC transporter substrate-binding protein [Saccharopolyspora erythraea]PFG95724.1 iron complex transport system substrate-binding protein [Saccharopolyspora erythraea NRRL 2338]QRK92320.1 ABC transporter substrate-binding protein [Saccharopolyspora erythraea]